MTYAATILGDSPVGYWPLNDPPGTVAVDLVGNHTGTYPASGVTFGMTSPLVREGGQSIAMNGGNTVISTASSFVTPASTSGEAWYNLAAAPSATVSFLGMNISSDGSGGTCDRFLQVNTSGRVNGSVFAGGSTRTAADGVSTCDGNWHHAVFTFGGGTLSLYVDGNLKSLGSGFGGDQSYTGFVCIGRSGGGGPLAPVGSFGQVAIYNYVLSPAQVSAHYQAGLGYGTVQPAISTFPVWG